MAELLVDVSNGLGSVIHTFPVQIENSESASDDGYKTKALKLAAHAQLVPQADSTTITASMHVSRPGSVTPFGDGRHILAGTEQGFTKVIGERAYFIWRDESCPQGRAIEHWFRALGQHLRERAYFIWQQENCPEGRADEHWHQSVEFETY
jgi:hypothetical protein